jgi:DNA helicase-2/ATP-dependent DNA helicase PcrA
MHSLCFRLAGRAKLAETAKGFASFSEAYPRYALSGSAAPSNDSENVNQGNSVLFQQMNINRNRMLPDKLYRPEVLKFKTAWMNFLNETGMTDYTGMLESVIERRLIPEDLQILYIDEAQDHSKLALAVIDLWASEAKKLVKIGDSDQALYRFAGAEPESFIDMKKDYEYVLNQSYRLPSAVRDFALKLIKRCTYRANVSYEAKYEGGSAEYTNDMPDLSLPGEHMIACRFKEAVKPYIEWLETAGEMWHNPCRPEESVWNPQKTKEWCGVKTYHQILQGETVYWSDIQMMADSMKAKHLGPRGTKKRLMDMLPGSKQADAFEMAAFGINENVCLGSIDIEELFSLKTQAGKLALKFLKHKPYMLVQEPRIKVGTVHSFKGDQADHVYYDAGLTYRIKNEMRNTSYGKDDEIRVSYVAVTRAKETIKIKNAFPAIQGIK